jgi:hypothetical protein
MEGIEPPDDRFAEDIAAALATLDTEVPDPSVVPEPRRTVANQYEAGGIPRGSSQDVG